MRHLIFTTIACILFATTYAQGNKSVFLEFGGNGLGLSANFDSRFKKSEKGFGYRVGIGCIPGTNSSADIIYPSTPFFLTIPVGINYLVGKAPHYFESGLGLTYMYTSGTMTSDFWGYEEDVSGSYAAFVPSIAYRHAKAGKAFQYRIIISPVISNGAVFWGGLSVGYQF